jgi:hypothetical protein
MSFLIDDVAREIALTRYALPDCLHVPVAAVDESAIRSYIGEIERVLSPGSPHRAFLVHAKAPPDVDPRLPIWDLPTSSILRQRRQIWVHIGFTRYRNAYQKAFPEEPTGARVLSHLMNRRIAALKGFAYVRITPTTRGCNSSSGFSENWGVALYSALEPNLTLEHTQEKRRRGAFIQYADLADLMVMLNIKISGGVMAVVNEGQRLVIPRP